MARQRCRRRCAQPSDSGRRLSARRRSRSFAGQLAAFHEGLKEGGYEDGRNVAIEYRWADGHNDRLPTHWRPIWFAGMLPSSWRWAETLAAKAATDTIPIVFNSGSDPIKLGMVTSLSRPGGNITGVSFFVSDLVAKGIDLLHQLIPAAKSVALLGNPKSPEANRQPEDAREAARRLGIQLKIANASTDAEIDQALRVAGADARRRSDRGRRAVLRQPDRSSSACHHTTAFRRCITGASSSPPEV